MWPLPDGKRWLAVDVGEKRIGLALSDPTGSIASPLRVLASAGRRQDIPAIVRLAEDHGVDGIVVGLPIRDDGEHTEHTERAARFARRLEAVFTGQVVTHDERFSTWEAKQRRLAAGRNRRSADDSEAAAIILESFLASRA